MCRSSSTRFATSGVAIDSRLTRTHTRTIVDPRYGAKLSGKVGKTTLGLLVANDEAPGRVDNRQDPAFGRTAQFIIGRARYDLYRESTASVIFTNREFMSQHSRAVGGDGDFAIGRTHRFFARVIATDHRDAAGVQRKGYFYDFNLRKAGRNVSYSLISNAISPDLRTDVGFVRRTDQRQSLGNISYRWWPEHWLISWAPRLNHMRNYQFDGTLQEETSGLTGSFTFAKNITSLRPVPRLQSDFSVAASSFRDARAGRQEFDVRFSDRCRRTSSRNGCWSATSPSTTRSTRRSERTCCSRIA